MSISANISAMAPVRFGEMYELRFQKEGRRPEAYHPLTLNFMDDAGIASTATNAPDPANNLGDYFAQHHLAATVVKVPLARTAKQSVGFNTPYRCLVLTDGPKENTFSRYKAITDEAWSSVSTDPEDLVKAYDEVPLLWFERFRADASFGDKFYSRGKLPVVTLRYTTQTVPEAVRKEYGENHGYRSYEKSLRFLPFIHRNITLDQVATWTNQPQVLSQIGADRIHKLDAQA